MLRVVAAKGRNRFERQTWPFAGPIKAVGEDVELDSQRGGLTAAAKLTVLKQLCDVRDSRLFFGLRACNVCEAEEEKPALDTANREEHYYDATGWRVPFIGRLSVLVDCLSQTNRLLI